MKDYGVRLERTGHIAVVTFDRPGRQNSMDEHMWTCFEGVITELKQNLPRVVVVTGAGEKAFCAGFDVNPENPQVTELAKAMETHDRAPAQALINRVRTSTDSLVFLPVPIIAAINGLAYGGGAEIASRCDLRVMDPEAVICFSEVKLGLMPDHGGVVGLTRLVGPAKAADLILTARKLVAQEALSLGVVNRISEEGRALETALELAEGIAKNGPRAVRHALKVIRKTPELSYMEALEMESKEAVDLIVTGECVHGIAAFLTKQKPEFPDPE
ncbi:MAG TPA: enoyl-CoA hydratase/isomerase family protein [Deltaproteobacteria bacterium]|nr:enoyl-CoA hydratase/isomerase family protein [Deltaproteobacteria bacterium]HPJ94722.1 enoyl-CoA hydratase/isomerase family protein [Deltaproteobacteria bacterium]HPR52280.1 enoyl-CoA hydratase/isomerase family protein [Deltaproteobacteria bacterium]